MYQMKNICMAGGGTTGVKMGTKRNEKKNENENNVACCLLLQIWKITHI